MESTEEVVSATDVHASAPEVTNLGIPVTKYLAPRINEEKYQSKVPAFDSQPNGDKSEKTGVHIFRGWSDLHSWALDRGLVEENFTEQDLPSTIFRENGWDSIQDIQTIQASIEALLGSGRASLQQKRMIHILHSQSTASRYAEYTERIIPKNDIPGLFASRPEVHALFQESSSNGQITIDEEDLYFTMDDDEAEEEVFAEHETIIVAEDTFGDGRTRASNRTTIALSAEKTEARNTWLKLLPKLEKVNEAKVRVNLREVLSLLREAMSVPMSFTKALRHSSNAPSAIAREDFMALESLRQVLGEIMGKVGESKVWLGRMRDLLLRGVFCGEQLASELLSSSLNNNHGGVHHSSQYSQPLREGDFLQELLSSASNLSFAPRAEEKFLQVVIKQAKELVNELKGLFTMTTISPLLTLETPTKHEEMLVMDRLKIFPEINVFDLEDILSHKWKLPSKRRLLDTSYVISLPLSALFERLGTHDICDITCTDEQVVQTAYQSYTQGNFSATLTYLADLLQASNANPLRMLETQYLQACVQSAQKLQSQLDVIIKIFQSTSNTQNSSFFTQNISFSSSKRNEKKRLSWSYIMSLVKIVMEYPLQLSSGVSFLTCLMNAITWRHKVMLYADDNSIKASVVDVSTADDSNTNLTLIEQEERRTSRQKASKSSQQKSSSNSIVKLSDVELLMKEGETFPLRFEREFSLLQKKKEQALEWIHRFKQLFASGSNKRSRVILDDDEHGSGHHVSNGKKMNVTLQELKEMMAAGEASLEPSQQAQDPSQPQQATVTSTTKASRGTSIQRELGKAMSAIEEAEDWIVRFKEITSTLFVKVIKGQDIDDDNDAILNSEEVVKQKQSEKEDEETSRQKRQTQRTLAIRRLKSFLSEANDLPVIIAEAEILKLQVAALEWAQKVDFSLLSIPEDKAEEDKVGESEIDIVAAATDDDGEEQEKIEGKLKEKEKKAGKQLKKLRLIEFNNLRHEIFRIRHDMSTLTSESQLLDELPEEKQFAQIAETVDLLLKRMKSCHTAKDIKPNVDYKKLVDLLTQAMNMPVNLENETKILRTAVDKVDLFVRENKSALQALQLLDLGKTAEEGSPVTTSMPTVSELEALRDIAMTITVDFQVKQQLIIITQNARLWKSKFAFVKSTLEILQTNLKFKVLTPEEQALLLGTKTRKTAVISTVNASKSAGLKADSSSFMITPLTLESLLSEATELKVDFGDDTKLVFLLQKFLQRWEQEVDSFIHSQVFPLVEKLFANLLAVFVEEEKKSFVATIFPFLQSLLPNQAQDGDNQVKLTIDDLFLQLEELIGASMKLTEIQRLSQLRHLSSLSLLVILEGILKKVQGFIHVATPTTAISTTWADINPEQVKHLQEEICSIYRILSSTTHTEEKSEPRDLLESIPVLRLCLEDTMTKEFADVGRPRLDVNQQEAEVEDNQEQADDDDEDADGDDGDEGGDINQQADEGQNQQAQGGEEIGSAVKGTRSSSGISKKRSAAETFALPISAPNAASSQTKGVKPKPAKGGGRWPNKAATAAVAASTTGSASKRRRVADDSSAFASETAATAATDVTFNNDAMDVVDDALEPMFESAAMLDPLASLSFLFSSSPDQLQGAGEKLTPLLSLIIQVITAFQHRLYEAEEWKDAMKRLEHIRSNNSNNSLQVSITNRNEKRQRLLTHLEVAETRGLRASLVTEARKRIEFFDTWIAMVSELLQNQIYEEEVNHTATAAGVATTSTTSQNVAVVKSKKVITLDELRELIKSGESSIFTSDLQFELTMLRNEAKKVKSWKTKLDTLRSLDASSTRALELQQALVSEAAELLVDVSEDVEALKQESTCYCLCRQLYFGEMVGCDHCEEWYHTGCANISASTLGKTEDYTCIRCAMKNALVSGASAASEICLKWRLSSTASQHQQPQTSAITTAIISAITNNATGNNHPSNEPFSDRLLQVYKINKRLAKLAEDRERFRQQQAVLMAQLDSSPKPQPSTMPSPHQGMVPGIGLPLPAQGLYQPNHAQQLSLIAQHMASSQAESDRIMIERQQIQTAAVHEEERRGVVSTWMTELTSILAPPIDDTVLSTSGAPVTPPTSIVQAGHRATMSWLRSYLATTPAIDRLLPPAVIGLHRRAVELNIANIEDVAIVLDAFRWMSWCSLGLYLLRFPPPSPLLRLFVAAKPQRCCDEKIVRHLQAIMTRATVWKSKARKALAKGRKVDELKLRGLVLEANNLPFSSRLKVGMQAALRSLDGSRPSSSTLAGYTRPVSVVYNGESSDDEGVEMATETAAAAAAAASSNTQQNGYIGNGFSFGSDCDSRLAALPEFKWPLIRKGGNSALVPSSSTKVAGAK